MSDPFASILGQDAAVAVLSRAASSRRIANSYLFEGPSGVGKYRAAIALASAVIGAGESDQKRIDLQRRIDGGTHPDVRVFRPRDTGDRNIQVDFVREQILPFTQFAPFEARAAFLILPEADVSFPDNHPEGANALLKTIEEPRAGVHFILLAERPDRLLVTIRSRCQRLRFGRLPSSVLESILERAQTPAGERTAAIALADGRADRALALTEDGAADALLATAMRIDEVAERGVPGEIVSLAEDLARNATLPEVLDALATFYRDVASASLGLSDELLAFRHRAPSVRERAQSLSAERAAAACERIRRLQDLFRFNANKEMWLSHLIADLSRA